jgi:hypothetical protein
MVRDVLGVTIGKTMSAAGYFNTIAKFDLSLKPVST